MPRGDGTGPTGQGPRGRSGRGKGRMGGPFAAGPGGNCVCPKCGKTVAHKVGQPCNELRCPNCGVEMVRS